MLKRKYITPAVEEIRLDNEISLQLASNPTSPDPDFNLSTGGEDDNYSYENW